MWAIRYLIPGIVLVLIGGFLFQNLGQRVTIHFLHWEFYRIPLVYIFVFGFVIGLALRYCLALASWLDKQRLKRIKKKIIKEQEQDKVIHTDESLSDENWVKPDDRSLLDEEKK